MARKSKQPAEPLQLLNGVTVSEIDIDQDGDLTVTFDMPVEQESKHYTKSLTASRTFNLYDEEELRELAGKLFKAVRKRIFEDPDPDLERVNCDSCKEARCCREHNVLLTGHDIKRLCKSVPEKEFLQKYTEKAVDWTGDFAYQLKSDSDEYGEKCIFLKRNRKGQMRCTVYKDRPRLCRDFDMETCELYGSFRDEEE